MGSRSSRWAGGDEYQGPGDVAAHSHRVRGSESPRVLHAGSHCVLPGAERSSATYVGRPPLIPRIQRMHACPKSTPSPYIIGHAPEITLMSCWRQYSTASGETLVPFTMDWCIHT